MVSSPFIEALIYGMNEGYVTKYYLLRKLSIDKAGQVYLNIALTVRIV